MTTRSPALATLDLLVGEWSMAARFDQPPTADADADARVVFEWLPGEQFLVERWSVPVPETPDGVAIIGLDPLDEERYLQHSFDSRGVARVYKMTLANNVWTLWRDEADFSPLDIRQRYTASISDDGQQITGSWETCHDGSTWEHDFELSYSVAVRVDGPGPCSIVPSTYKTPSLPEASTEVSRSLTCLSLPPPKRQGWWCSTATTITISLLRSLASRSSGLFPLGPCPDRSQAARVEGHPGSTAAARFHRVGIESGGVADLLRSTVEFGGGHISEVCLSKALSALDRREGQVTHRRVALGLRGASPPS
ncbi:MAG: hypothetical protein ACRD2W_20465 [Acidimicrobiales bacterium]